MKSALLIAIKISCRSVLMNSHGVNGTLYRTGEHITGEHMLMELCIELVSIYYLPGISIPFENRAGLRDDVRRFKYLEMR